MTTASGLVSFKMSTKGERRSTAVLPEYRDHGVAAELIAKALDDIRASGKKVTVICPIVRTVIDHHPQYEDLIDKEHPGVRIKRPA